MGKNTKSDKKCELCIHENACQTWNVGVIHNMDATNCVNYETLKEMVYVHVEGKYIAKYENLWCGLIVTKKSMKYTTFKTKKECRKWLRSN